MITFHPLILKFLAHFDDAHLHAHLAETITRQWLRQHICNLLFSADMGNVQPPIIKTFPNEMKPHIYLLTPVMKNGILTESYSRLAIHLK